MEREAVDGVDREAVDGVDREDKIVADKAVADKAVADKMDRMEVQTDKRNSQDRTYALLIIT